MQRNRCDQEQQCERINCKAIRLFYEIHLFNKAKLLASTIKAVSALSRFQSYIPSLLCVHELYAADLKTNIITSAND